MCVTMYPRMVMDCSLNGMEIKPYGSKWWRLNVGDSWMLNLNQDTILFDVSLPDANDCRRKSDQTLVAIPANSTKAQKPY